MFRQGEPPVERSRPGLGLGLTLAQKLVDMHGGSIEARSEGLGRGSEFTVALPLVEAPAPLKAVRARSGPQAFGGTFRKPTGQS